MNPDGRGGKEEIGRVGRMGNHYVNILCKKRVYF